MHIIKKMFKQNDFTKTAVFYFTENFQHVKCIPVVSSTLYHCLIGSDSKLLLRETEICRSLSDSQCFTEKRSDTSCSEKCHGQLQTKQRSVS